VLDDIRLAANDAFFSLPRGGAEIGGILLGGWQEGRLTISDCVALDCEHAMGPSFTLSLKDETKLQELIGAARASGVGLPVGWYHSHTRSGVLLTDSDLTIHNRFFPEPWQVALVVRPQTSEPMRGGFFFRGSGGIIHSSASYREFSIEPVPMRQVPRAVPMEQPAQPPSGPAPAGVIVDVRAEPEVVPPPAPPIVNVQVEPAEPPTPSAPIIDVRAKPAVQSEPPAPAQASVPEATPPAAPAQVPLPSMFESRHKPAPRWAKALVALGVAACAGVGIYAARDIWYPFVVTRAPAENKAGSIGLNTADEGGQLQIRWDANSGAVHSATSASLEIGDGDLPQNFVPLEVRQLASGVFTYQRHNERVDVTLVLDQPGRTKVRQTTSFLGQKPPAPAAPESPVQPNREREEMLRTVAGLRAQLDAERERSNKAEKELATIRAQLHEQQLRRLSKQALPPAQ
jgi:hypothetical protein